MTEPELDVRLGKIVALVKHGVGGERENALKLVRTICKRYNLSFDEVMSDGEAVNEYAFYYRTKEEEAILGQVLLRFAVTPEHPKLMQNVARKVLLVECTPRVYVEARHAWSIYLAAYRKERRRVTSSLPLAFTMKHRLYRQFELNSEDAPKDITSFDEYEQAIGLARHMDDVTILPSIEAGNSN